MQIFCMYSQSVFRYILVPRIGFQIVGIFLARENAMCNICFHLNGEFRRIKETSVVGEKRMDCLCFSPSFFFLLHRRGPMPTVQGSVFSVLPRGRCHELKR